MEEWYVLSAAGKHEAAAAELMERRLGGELFSRLAVPRRAKAFRSGGTWHRMEEILFPGHVFVKTARGEELSKALLQSRAFPQPLGIGAGSVPEDGRRGRGGAGAAMVPVEQADLAFLQDVCGEELTEVMGMSRITLGAEREIVETQGALLPYLDRLVRLNLHKRFAVVEVPLFNRTQRILFGVELIKDSDVLSESPRACLYG